MTKTIEEKTHAMHLLSEGLSRAAVSRLTGIDTKTLGRYWTRFQAEGEEFFKERRKPYSVKFKKTVLDDIKKKGQTISLVSAKYGVPAITIRRWIASKEKAGSSGLKDGRQRNTGPYWNKVQNRAGQAVTLALRSLSETTDGTMVREELQKRGAFENPIFGTFLINLFNMYSFLILKDEDDEKGRRMMAYTSARIQLYLIPHTVTLRQQTDELIDLPETTAFISTYLDSITALMNMESAQK